LKDVEPVSYCETEPKKEKHSEDDKTAVIEIGAKEEIYTEEHDKLLGTCSTPALLGLSLSMAMARMESASMIK